MTFAVVHWRSPRKPRRTYATECNLFNGGCPRNVGRRTIWLWCAGCRRLRNERIAARRKP